MATRIEIVERLRGLQHDDGRLDPREVVEDARDPASPLHDSFEWDESTAAEQYRLLQARRLIGSVKFLINVNRVPMPAPVYVRDPDNVVYRTVVALRSDEDKARAAVTAEMARVQNAIKRAKTLAAALGVAGELDRIDEMIESLVRRVRSVYEQPEGNA